MKIVKGEKRGKPGRWIVDYRDALGIRRWKVLPTKQEAEDFVARTLPTTRRRRQATVDPQITVKGYSEPRTVESARQMLRLHVWPVFGEHNVRRLDRGPIVDHLSRKLAGGLARNTVRLIHAALRGLLTDAVELDGLLPTNPAGGDVAKRLRLVASPRARTEAIKALDREQLCAFLEAARTHRDAYVRRYTPSFCSWPGPAFASARRTRCSGRTSLGRNALSASNAPSPPAAWERQRPATVGTST